MSQSPTTQRTRAALSTAATPDVPATPSLGRAAAWQWIRRAAPTAAVVGLLAGLAAWGHYANWNLPRFSALLGADAAGVEDWCQAHNVAESECIECHVGLAPPAQDYGWCRAHGIPQCTLCHPEVAQLKSVPPVSADDRARAERALALLPRRENNSLCKLHQKRIQFASVAALDKAGVDIAVVQTRPIIEAVLANGEVIYDQTRMAHLASRVAGTVWRVEKQVGDRVYEGEILALVDGADVGRAKTELLRAVTQLRLKQTNVDRLEPLVTDGSIPERQFREAAAALEEAQVALLSAQQTLVNLGLPVRADDLAELDTKEIAQHVKFLGLPTAMVASLDPDATTSNLYPLRSPLDGVIVDRHVVAGEVVSTSQMLFSVADIGRMWLMLDVRQDDVRYVALGQRVLFQPSDSRGAPEITGSVSWISTAADDQTRTVKVRVDLPNSDSQLRANTFGTGRLVLREEPRAVVVPNEAVHSEGCCSVVFVRDKNFHKEGAAKFFHIRKVRLGFKDQDATEIIAGLLPGEVIAAKNSVVLEAQLQKSNLGAGCGCADGH